MSIWENNFKDKGDPRIHNLFFIYNKWDLAHSIKTDGRC